MIKEQTDEQWKPGSMLWVLTNHRAEEHTINYAESHDQALVGDKTIIFRLADADMYWFMSKLQPSSYAVDRAIALHKMIRLITLTAINGGYLNFMGNEFGHPGGLTFHARATDGRTNTPADSGAWSTTRTLNIAGWAIGTRP